MPRKSFAKVIAGVILAELFFVFPFVFWGGGYEDSLTLLIAVAVFVVPVIPIFLIWRNLPEGSWVRKLLWTWVVLFLFSLITVMMVVGSYASTLDGFIQNG